MAYVFRMPEVVETRFREAEPAPTGPVFRCRKCRAKVYRLLKGGICVACEAKAAPAAKIVGDDKDGDDLTPAEWLAEHVGRLQAFGVCVRTVNFLTERRIETIGDLLNTLPAKLLAIPNFGPKSLEEVYRALEAIGFRRRRKAAVA